MANVKTAISMEKPLFREVEVLAQELKISRSHLFALAAREFIERHNNKKLLDAINKAYDDTPDTDDQENLRQMRSKHRALVKRQW